MFVKVRIRERCTGLDFGINRPLKQLRVVGGSLRIDVKSLEAMAVVWCGQWENAMFVVEFDPRRGRDYGGRK